MKYEAAKCPNCGAQLQLDDSLETGFCTYCGGKLFVQDAIKRMKVELVGQVSVTGISTIENDIMLGQQCIASQDWDPAINIYRKAIGKKADSFDAWFGYLKAITKNFTGFYYYEHEKGVYGLESVYQSCMQLADETQRHLVQENMESLLALLQHEETDLDQKNTNGKEFNSKLTRKKVVLCSATLILFIIAIALDNSNNFDASGFLGILGVLLLALIGFSIFAFNDRAHINVEGLNHLRNEVTLVSGIIDKFRAK